MSGNTRGMYFVFQPEDRARLEVLSKADRRSMTGTISVLLERECAERGLEDKVQGILAAATGDATPAGAAGGRNQQ